MDKALKIALIVASCLLVYLQFHNGFFAGISTIITFGFGYALGKNPPI